MGITIEHQPSPAGVGMAAYAAGLGKARERQKKQALELLQEQQRLRARQQEFGYRAALSGMRRGGAGAQAEGATIEDPLAGASGAGAVQIQAQRKANARASRMGQPTPYPDAEPKTILPPTPAEERRQAATTAHDRAVGMAKTAEAGRDRRTSEEEDLDLLKVQDAESKAQVDAIQKATGGMFPNDSEMTKAWGSMGKTIGGVTTDKDGEGRLSPTEQYEARIAARQKVIGLYAPDKHDVRPEEQPGGIRIENGERWRNPMKPDGEPTFAGFVEEPGMTEEGIQRGESNLFRDFGTVRYQKVMTAHGPKWEEMNTGGMARPEYNKTRDEWATIIDKSTDRIMKGLSKEESAKPDMRDKIRRDVIASGNYPDPLQGVPVPGPAGGAQGQPAPGAAGQGAPAAPAAAPAKTWRENQPDRIAPPQSGPMPDVPEGFEEPPEGLEALLQPVPAEEMGEESFDPGVEARTMQFNKEQQRSSLRQPFGPQAAETKATTAPRTGPPVDPPQGKAAEAIAKKGYDYVPILNSEGKATGKMAWRKPEAEGQQQGQLSVVRTPEELAALPSGAEFLDEAGRKRRKK